MMRGGAPGSAAQRRRWAPGAVVSLVCALLLFTSGVVVATAVVVRQATIGSGKLTPWQSRLAIAIATWPGRAREVLSDIPARIRGESPDLLYQRSVVEKANWTRSFPAADDPGYLLLSGVDPVRKQSTVRLLRVADGLMLAEWIPDWDAIYSRITDKPGVPRGTPRNARAVHPMLMENGDVVFNTGHSLVRMSACSQEPLWVLDQVIHHSVELDGNGNFLVSGVSYSSDGFPENEWMQGRIRDDSIARVSPTGVLLENLSVVRILRENGLEGLLLGTHGSLIPDPLHINQIEEARSSGSHWSERDLLISLRHLSTVLLYRPSTSRVIWYKTGPWLNQHNAVFYGDRSIAVFDNHIVAGVPGGFLSSGGRNRIVVLDLETGAIQEPFSQLLDRDRPATVTEGRFRLLGNGGMFVEDSDNGRHLRYGNGRLMWSRINDFDSTRIGNVAWSRYLTEEEAKGPIGALKDACKSDATASMPASR